MVGWPGAAELTTRDPRSRRRGPSRGRPPGRRIPRRGPDARNRAGRAEQVVSPRSEARAPPSTSMEAARAVAATPTRIPPSRMAGHRTGAAAKVGRGGDPQKCGRREASSPSSRIAGLGTLTSPPHGRILGGTGQRRRSTVHAVRQRGAPSGSGRSTGRCSGRPPHGGSVCEAQPIAERSWGGSQNYFAGAVTSPRDAAAAVRRVNAPAATFSTIATRLRLGTPAAGAGSTSATQACCPPAGAARPPAGRPRPVSRAAHRRGRGLRPTASAGSRRGVGTRAAGRAVSPPQRSAAAVPNAAGRRGRPAEAGPRWTRRFLARPRAHPVRHCAAGLLQGPHPRDAARSRRRPT